MRRGSTWRWIVAAVGAVALLGAACGGGDEAETPGGGGASQFPANTTLGKIQQQGEIVIGVKFDVPPFGFKNPQSGQVEGFDVDLGKHIADALGVRPKFVEAISDNRIPFLKDGTVDLILSTMTITTDRDAEIDFSEPYFIAHGRVLVPKDSDIQSVEDLAGKTVCTALGSTYEENLKENAPDAELKLVDAYSECLALVQTDAVDAVSTDDVILTGMIIQDPDLKLVGEEITTEPYGAGIKDGDAQLKEFVDQVIADVKADGRWVDMFDKWVGQYTGQDAEVPTLTLPEALELRPCVETC
ncbi:MAG TPA: glutamate ABC transporter substrate-binding protein [Actinomycetota bacterium]|nr:glutamate ABC transporter substrate-binding protein [Actinomycetota bacterium]